MSEIDRITIHSPNLPPYTIARLYPEDLDESVARQVLQLASDSYEAEYTGSTTGIPRGAFYAHFVARRDAPEQQLDRMHSYMDKGGSYWLARLEPEPEEAGWFDAEHEQRKDETKGPLAGLIKYSPSRATLLQKVRLAAPNLFLNDIMVHPDHQGKGMGTALVYNVLQHSGYKPNVKVALHALKGSTVPNWFRRLGFIARKEIAPLEIGDDHRLEQRLMVARSIRLVEKNIRLLPKHSRLMLEDGRKQLD